jgi:hypothetical protein
MRKTSFEPIFAKKIFGCAEDLLRISDMFGSGHILICLDQASCPAISARNNQIHNFVIS